MKKIFLILIVLWFVNYSFGATWYVRPAGGSYGGEDGTAYADAWDGLKSVVWGGAGVVAGDTLYVCGTHYLTTAVAPSSNRNWVIGADGTSGNEITIRGDYGGDAGIIWGCHRADEVWASEGSGTYSTALSTNSASHFWFEDISGSSYTMLVEADDIQDCKDTPGSYYGAAYNITNTVYVHCNDGLDPTDRIGIPYNGWNIYISDREYITFLNLTFYEPIFAALGADVHHITWDGCKLWYDGGGFLVRDNWHHLTFNDCDRAYGVGGIAMQDLAPRGANEPHHITISNCTIHDIGVYAHAAANADSEGIGANGPLDVTIEYNEFYNCGTAISFFCYPDQNCPNLIIAYNYMHDMHSIAGARNRGIELSMDGSNTGDKSGCEVYGNIVANITSRAYSCSWQTDEVKFYNNVAYNCYTAFWFSYSYNSDYGPNITMKNNISFDIDFMHVYFSAGNAAQGDYAINSDYNIFNNANLADSFRHNDVGGLTKGVLTVWQALSKSGCTFDVVNSLTGDPLFVNEGGGNFALQSGSPARDKGVDVGLTEDFIGTSIPQNVLPDIGAYEFIIGGGVGGPYLVAKLFSEIVK